MSLKKLYPLILSLLIISPSKGTEIDQIFNTNVNLRNNIECLTLYKFYISSLPYLSYIKDQVNIEIYKNNVIAKMDEIKKTLEKYPEIDLSLDDFLKDQDQFQNYKIKKEIISFVTEKNTLIHNVLRNKLLSLTDKKMDMLETNENIQFLNLYILKMNVSEKNQNIMDHIPYVLSNPAHKEEEKRKKEILQKISLVNGNYDSIKEQIKKSLAGIKNEDISFFEEDDDYEIIKESDSNLYWFEKYFCIKRSTNLFIIAGIIIIVIFALLDFVMLSLLFSWKKSKEDSTNEQVEENDYDDLKEIFDLIKALITKWYTRHFSFA